MNAPLPLPRDHRARVARVAVALLVPAALAAACTSGMKRYKTPDDLRAAGEYPSYAFDTGTLGVTHYEVREPTSPPTGTPRTIVLVHGVSGPLNVWDRAVGPLTDAGFRVLRYDLFGRGLSTRLVDSKYDLAVFRQQIDELTAHLAPTGSLDVVGSSYGGVIASDFALRHAERMRGLVLIGPAGTPINITPLAHIANVPVLGDLMFLLFGERAIITQNRKYFVGEEPPPELWRMFLAQLGVDGTAEAMRSTHDNPTLRDFSAGFAALARTKIPVGLIWGRNDVTFPFANHTLVQNALPAATLVPIDAAGHLPQYEKPETTSPALLTLLAAMPAPSVRSPETPTGEAGGDPGVTSAEPGEPATP